MPQKTNAARFLDQMGISYELREYEVDPDDLAAEVVATKIGLTLEQIMSPNGNIDIRLPRSSKDDMAIAVALAGFELSRVPERSGVIRPGLPKPPSPSLWRIAPAYDWQLPSYGTSYGSQAPTCSKYPGCFEPGATCECYE